MRQTGWALLIALGLSTPIMAVGGAIIYADRAERAAISAMASERPLALTKLLNAPPLPPLAADVVAQGRAHFASSCAACHGHSAEGVRGLGKSLVSSWFVASLDDTDLQTFLRVGRAADHPDSETKIPMPPKGGNEALTEQDLGAIVAYMRGLQDRRRMPDLPEIVQVAAVPSQQELERALAAAGGDLELAEYIASGSALYASSCAACHGKNAEGVKGNGKSLVNNAFCNSLDDEALLAFLKKGRDPGDPANTTGVGMPAKGGNPALDDDDLLDIIAFVRSLDVASSQK